MAGDTATGGPSTKEALFFFSVLSNLKDINVASVVDWDAVAAEIGYNSGATARVRYGQIRRDINKKKGATAGDDDSSPAKATTPAKAKATPKVKAPKADTTSKVVKTPTKAKAKGKGKAAKKEADKQDENAKKVIKEDESADEPEGAAEAHEDEEIEDDK